MRKPFIITIVSVVSVAILVFAGLIFAAANVDTSPPGNRAVATGTVAPELEYGVDDEQQTEKSGPALNKSHIVLTTKEKEKQCFGDAGCNLTLAIKMAYSGPKLSESDIWEVTYQVSGVQDGPLIGTFEVSGDTYTENEEFVSTSNKNKKVTVKVLSVEKVGL